VAVIKQLRGVDVRFGGRPHRGWIPNGASVPPPTPEKIVKINFEIHQSNAGFFFVYGGSDPEYCGDSWHESLNEALEAAKESFGIEVDEWESVESEGN
jgi:hypothetical protein